MKLSNLCDIKIVDSPAGQPKNLDINLSVNCGDNN